MNTLRVAEAVMGSHAEMYCIKQLLVPESSMPWNLRRE